MSSKYSPERCLKRRQRLGYMLYMCFDPMDNFKIRLDRYKSPHFEGEPMQGDRAFARGRGTSHPDPRALLAYFKVCNLTKAENEDIRLLWGEYTLPEFGYARR